MGQVYAVFRNTFLEAVRQPVYALVLVVSCLMIAISPALAAHIYTFPAGSGMEDPAGAMIADLGLATMLLAGLVLAVLVTSSVIDREIRNKTALTVLSKHLSRTAFIFGKFLGAAAAIGMAALTNIMFIMLTIRIGAPINLGGKHDMGIVLGIALCFFVAAIVASFRNYFRRRAWVGSFTLSLVTSVFVLFLTYSVLDKNYDFVLTSGGGGDVTDDGHGHTAAAKPEGAGETYDWNVATAGVMTLLGILSLSGVSIAASTRLEAGGNLVVSGLAFAGGLTIEYIDGKISDPLADMPEVLLMIADFGKVILPNMQIFYMSDAITREKEIPVEYLLWAGSYAACYVLAMLFFAAFLFQKREIT